MNSQSLLKLSWFALLPFCFRKVTDLYDFRNKIVKLNLYRIKFHPQMSDHFDL